MKVTKKSPNEKNLERIIHCEKIVKTDRLSVCGSSVRQLQANGSSAA
jgi:hypothetical protein